MSSGDTDYRNKRIDPLGSMHSASVSFNCDREPRREMLTLFLHEENVVACIRVSLGYAHICLDRDI